MTAYVCPVCGITDSTAYQRCYHPGCTDGRDPRPAPRACVTGDIYTPLAWQALLTCKTPTEQAHTILKTITGRDPSIEQCRELVQAISAFRLN